MPQKIKVTQIRSGIGRIQRQKDTLRSLGLRRLHQTVVKSDTPHIRGMVESIRHLVQFEFIEE